MSKMFTINITYRLKNSNPFYSFFKGSVQHTKKSEVTFVSYCEPLLMVQTDNMDNSTGVLHVWYVGTFQVYPLVLIYVLE